MQTPPANIATTLDAVHLQTTTCALSITAALSLMVNDFYLFRT